MKSDTGILATKALCYVIIGALTPFAASLAQWANSDMFPPKIVWIVIISSSITGGATQLLSFLSGSYSDYVKGRNGANQQTIETKSP